MKLKKMKSEQRNPKMQSVSQFTLLEALVSIMIAGLIFVGVHSVFSINVTQSGQALHTSLANQSGENFLQYNMSRIKADREWLNIFADTKAAIDSDAIIKGQKPIQNIKQKLFTIDATFQQDLQEGALSQSLRNKFSENGIQLPSTTTLSTLEENTEWLLEAGSKRYTFTNQEERIAVSQSKFMVTPDSQFDESQVMNTGVFWYWQEGFTGVFRLAKKVTVTDNNSKKIDCELEISWPAEIHYKERNKKRFSTHAFFAAKVPLEDRTIDTTESPESTCELPCEFVTISGDKPASGKYFCRTLVCYSSEGETQPLNNLRVTLGEGPAPLTWLRGAQQVRGDAPEEIGSHTWDIFIANECGEVEGQLVIETK